MTEADPTEISKQDPTQDPAPADATPTPKQGAAPSRVAPAPEAAPSRSVILSVQIADTHALALPVDVAAQVADVAGVKPSELDQAGRHPSGVSLRNMVDAIVRMAKSSKPGSAVARVIQGAGNVVQLNLEHSTGTVTGTLVMKDPPVGAVLKAKAPSQQQPPQQPAAPPGLRVPTTSPRTTPGGPAAGSAANPLGRRPGLPHGQARGATPATRGGPPSGDGGVVMAPRSPPERGGR